MRRNGVWARVGLLVAVGAAGCGEGGSGAPAISERPFRGVRLTVAAVGDPAVLQAIAARRGEWEREQEAEVVVEPKAIGPDEVERFDVVVFPGERMGDLIDRGALAVVPDAAVRPPRIEAPPGGPDPTTAEAPADPLGFADLVPAYREQVARSGEGLVALPLGGTALVLAYRRDAFESEANRDAARAAGIALDPPKTWDDLDALAKFFQTRDWDGDGAAGAGLAVALGPDAEEVADSVVFARAASLGATPDRYSFHFDADSLAPRVADPPFVEALRGVVAWQAVAPPGAERFDAEAARAAFRAGKAALLIDRAERAASWTDSKRPLAVGVAALPGSRRVYDPDRRAWQEASSPNRPAYLPVGGGWLAGLATRAPDRRAAALAYLKWLAGAESSQAIATDPAFPMLPVRSTALGVGLPDPRSAPGVDGRAWGIAVGQTLQAPRVVVGLRIPDAPGYLADLASARASALAGTPPDEALRVASEAWARRSERLGTKRQLWHYRRSLNRLVTDEKPPEK